MAIDYEKKVDEAMLTYIRSDYHDTRGNLIVFLRQFAAEVIRDAAAENDKGWNLPEVTKLFNEWLERRAAEIEEKASHE